MPNETLKKLYEERLKVDADQKAILDKAEDEKRDLNEDENTNYENLEKRFNEINDEIKKEQENEKRELENAKAQKEAEELAKKRRDKHLMRDQVFNSMNAEGIRPEPDKDKDESEYRSVYADKRYVNLFTRYLEGVMDDKQMRSELSIPELRATLQVDKDLQGGFVAPPQFTDELIIDLNNETFMRSICRNQMLPTALKFTAPVLGSDPSDPTWTAEVKTGAEDAAMQFQQYTFTCHPLAKRVRVSNTLVRVAKVMGGIDRLVRERLAYVFGTTEENAFLNGTGAGQPLGVFTSSSNGISSSRDVTTGATTTATSADHLIETEGNLKAQYRRNAQWIFHRNWLTKIRKLKTSAGDYIWIAGIAPGRPDMVLGHPVNESEYAPNTMTSGNFVGIIGNFQFYYIVTALDMQIQALFELYAETNEVGYIARMETDAAPVRENAFSRAKLS